MPASKAGVIYLVRFAATELTSIYPMTGQLDFAQIVIDDALRDGLVESKSLKLFLHSAAITGHSTRIAA